MLVIPRNATSIRIPFRIFRLICRSSEEAKCPVDLKANGYISAVYLGQWLGLLQGAAGF